MRGVIDELVDSLRGPEARVTVEPGVPDGLVGFEPASTGTVAVDGEPIGVLGLVAPAVRGQFELAGGAGAVACELDVPALIRGYPPRRRVRALPVFPAIDRDLSLIVDEGVRWGTVAGATAAAAPGHLRHVRFVGTYRGKPIPEGKKSVTLTMEFRDDARTLRDDEVNQHVAAITEALARAVGATVRQ
jgi:phenylalanyl-tRNA synthetase beta chain